MIQNISNQIVQMINKAGQSLAEWLASPEGQRYIRKVIQQHGPGVLQELYRQLKEYYQKHK